MGTGTLPQRFLDAAGAHGGRGPAPVERWNPPYCGEIDLRIARDGSWHYQGSPILRMPLVRLFASILRNDGDRHVLVTPVERVGIAVEDAPFLAVEIAPVAGENGPTFAFRTNLDDGVVAGPAHPVRFELEPGGGLKPYIRIRGELWARATRAVALDLVEHFSENDAGRAGLWLDGAFFPVPETESCR